jgi:hypothetical protein
MSNSHGLAAPTASELCGDKTLFKARGRREDRAPAGTHGPRAEKSTRQNHRCSRKYPAFPARWLERRIPRSPRGPGFLAPVIRETLVERSANLAPASGRQDHTAWPSAKRSFVGTLKRMLRPRAATAPRLHVRDDRDTPLCTRRDARKMRLIWGKAKAEYFSADIWTGRIELIAQQKLVFWCKSFCGENRLRRRQERRRSNSFLPGGRSRHIARVGSGSASPAVPG